MGEVIECISCGSLLEIGPVGLSWKLPKTGMATELFNGI